MGVENGQLRAEAALETVRAVLIALIFVALLGSVAAVLTFRQDVRETREQVRERVAQQGRLYSDSLGLHFEVLRSELKRVADRGFTALASHSAEVLDAIREDRTLFGEGVALLDLNGRLQWIEPHLQLRNEPRLEPWFQQVIALEQATVDEFVRDDSSRLAVALPVREEGRLSGVLVGIVGGSDQLLYGIEGPQEQRLLLSSRGHALLPLSEPTWSLSPDFAGRVDGLRARGGVESWTLGGAEVLAAAFSVKNTGLQVLSLETEEATIAPIRRRLMAQLVFLLVVQVAALGAFVLFLRRTWRAFLEAESRIVEQEKMAALGTAASLIAHEVKNSLNGLKAASSLLATGGDSALAGATITGQVDRLAHLARSLLSFARPAELRRVPVQLDELVGQTVAALSSLPEWPEASVTTELSPVLLDSDPLLLTTAVDNLARNAIEAAVAAKDLGHVTEPRVLVRVTRSANVAVVRVEDNAGGAPADFESRFGEPFFTTKPRGIGLGLAMTLRAVGQLGGALSFTRLATGSCFELKLPIDSRDPSSTQGTQ